MKSEDKQHLNNNYRQITDVHQVNLILIQWNINIVKKKAIRCHIVGKFK